MATKFLVCATIIIAVAQAAMVPSSNIISERNREHDSRSQYTYDYNTPDLATRDYNLQGKSRDVDVVREQYPSVLSNGPERVIGYRHNPINGFKIEANVPTERTQKIIAPVIPISVTHGSSPITYENQAYPDYALYSPYAYSSFGVHPAPYYAGYKQVYY